MRYPPAISIEPQGSGLYRAVVMVFAMLIIANYSINTGANGLFSLQNTALALVSGLVLTWALIDAWRRPVGTLQFSEGQWLLMQVEQPMVGTLSLHLDLQTYMLVRFQAQATTSDTSPIKTQWFHLQARRLDPATWLALRRAVHSPRAAEMAVREEGAV